jgi:hypothetical protein
LSIIVARSDSDAISPRATAFRQKGGLWQDPDQDTILRVTFKIRDRMEYYWFVQTGRPLAI